MIGADHRSGGPSQRSPNPSPYKGPIGQLHMGNIESALTEQIHTSLRTPGEDCSSELITISRHRHCACEGVNGSRVRLVGFGARSTRKVVNVDALVGHPFTDCCRVALHAILAFNRPIRN